MILPDDKIRKFIGRHHVMTLATVSDDGQPWCSNVFYAYMPQENIFVFASDHDARHAREMLADPRVSASIVLETKVVGKLRGLQLEGRARPVVHADGNSPRNAYLGKFPYAVAMPLELWVLKPSFFKLTDNTLGFGKKITWDNGRPER